MSVKQLVIDAWSWLNYKPVFAHPVRGMPNRRVFPEPTAMWVPEQDQRCLAAYKLLAAYDNNQAGQLAACVGDRDAHERREYGDPSMFVEVLLANAPRQVSAPAGNRPGRPQRTMPPDELSGGIAVSCGVGGCSEQGVVVRLIAGQRGGILPLPLRLQEGAPVLGGRPGDAPLGELLLRPAAVRALCGGHFIRRRYVVDHDVLSR
ncbi:hypothetical protein ACFYMW_39660 [Streptomyces sp. NPDC006692]|uniref:hypothetical protein n=1 Tax=Streptomyces sp. NPDC006692 TaxID=3364758 RepID=UPI0036C4BAE8